MTNRVNQAVLIIAIIAVLAWVYMKYTTHCKGIEKYEMDKSQIMNHITTSSKIDSVLTMTAAAKLTTDDALIQQAYDLAKTENREELVKFFEKL